MKDNRSSSDENQTEEQGYWGDCTNTLGEELKQLVYARYMGLYFHEVNGVPYCIDMRGKTVLDVGGGPASLVLKTVNSPKRSVVNPCEHPDWVQRRYADNGINYYRIPGEELSSEDRYDEVWMYNCLRFTQNPELLVKNCLKALKPGGVFRYFEWVNTDVDDKHPVSLTSNDLSKWTGQDGGLVFLNESGCVGHATYDIVHKD